MDLFSFIECAKRTQSIKELFDLLVSCASEEGFSEVAYGALTCAEPPRLPEYLPPAVTVNFPPDWCHRYFERNYHVIDPVVRRTPMISGPFLWDELAKQYQLQSGEQRVLDEAREAGLKCAMSVPLFGPSGQISVASFASPSTMPILSIASVISMYWPGTFTSHLRKSRGPRLAAASGKFRCRIAKRLPAVGAEGKSSWAIGMILKISENTVNFHFKNAMRKLGTTSRTQAIVKAVRLNLIEFSAAPGLPT